MSKKPQPEMEGLLSVTGGEVWYRVSGCEKGRPLIVVHGGPGSPHIYLSSLAALADERPILFYDQLGAGRSSRPEDQTLWTIERFLTELSAMVELLAKPSVYLLGHSWGSILAVEYALTTADKLAGLILASPCLSIPKWIEDADNYRKQLPIAIQEILDKHEAQATTFTNEYQIAVMNYYQRHICRKRPWPELLSASAQEMNEQIYQTMWGENEFNVTGSLKDYDCTSRLSEISLPTLFTCGRYDEATPETTEWYRSLMPNAEIAVFEESAHLPHLEEEQAYLKTVRDFLHKLEAKRSEF